MTKQLSIPEMQALIKAERRTAIPPVSFFLKHFAIDASSLSNLSWKEPLAGQIKVGQRAGTKAKGYWRVLIDHINGNTFNNDIDNLRYANNVDNGMNSIISSNNTSGRKGCNSYETKNGTRYTWRLQGLKLQGSGFLTMDEAARARDRVVIANFPWLGANCGLNFPYSEY
jgi:hypothetical protein